MVEDDFDALFRAALPPAPAPPFDVPFGLRERTLAAIAPPWSAPRRRRRRWRIAIPAAAAAAAAATAVLAVAIVAARGGDVDHYTLIGGTAEVTATVQTTGVGREVVVSIDRLIDPRPDGLYELWFVAPDDRSRHPRRVSAGTFHPDDAGTGKVRLVAAADPKTYTRIEVTLEPADGNPRRQGPTVLRAAETEG
jgi:anti-sigma-K factor RskA